MAAGAQAPIWVPIVVGVIGLAGVIASQVIAGIRATGGRVASDRREETRYRRSQDELQALRDREDRFRAHSDRTAAYARLSLEVTRLRYRLRRAQAEHSRSSQGLADSSMTLLKEALDVVDEAGATVELLAPGKVRTAWLAAHISLVSAWNVLLDDDSTSAATKDALSDIEGPVDEMLAAMREDLGVE